jgi:hypothetical protein
MTRSECRRRSESCTSPICAPSTKTEYSALSTVQILELLAGMSCGLYVRGDQGCASRRPWPVETRLWKLRRNIAASRIPQTVLWFRCIRERWHSAGAGRRTRVMMKSAYIEYQEALMRERDDRARVCLKRAKQGDWWCLADHLGCGEKAMRLTALSLTCLTKGLSGPQIAWRVLQMIFRALCLIWR